MRPLSLTINGEAVSAVVEPRTHLADFLREAQDLTGTHLGCEHGVCGACTILIDGAPARSCITYAVQCDGAAVTTIEGLDEDEIMRELREAFSREHALQCGYCTPGMLVSARDLVIRLPNANERAIRIGMSGNLCRCTGYVGIVRAVTGVIAARRARGVAAIAGAGRTALGPVGSDHAPISGTSIHRTSRRPQAEPPGSTPTTRTTPTGDWADWRPQATFEETFVVDHPPGTVWDFFGRVDEVAACLPGAALTGEPAPEHVEGYMRAKLGPVTAEFSGEADIERDTATRTGRIRGAGRDARNNSTTRGQVVYRLVSSPGGNSTQVHVEVGYSLTGMLAQFGRSGLVQDVAHRMTSAFAENLEARLTGGASAAPQPAAELNAASLLLSVVGARLRGFVRRVFRR